MGNQDFPVNIITHIVKYYNLGMVKIPFYILYEAKKPLIPIIVSIHDISINADLFEINGFVT